MKYLLLISVVLFFICGCDKNSTGQNNQSPDPPTNPLPEDGAISVSIHADLSWECSDPDDDSLTYDVYFGTDPNPDNDELVSNNQAGTIYNLAQLDYGTNYYWKIIVSDGEDETEGDVWQFATESEAGYGTVTDIDGNVYQTLVIGNQEWMVENLKVSHYRNGDQILHVPDNGNWISTNDGAYCIYDNNPSNADTYGNLYNWYAVDDPRGLAPEGWHVPSDEDIIELEMYLGMNYFAAHDTGWRGTNEGSKLAGRADLWTDGALENDPEFESSGFDFLPGGYRNGSNGNFSSLGSSSYLWSSSEDNSKGVWYRSLYYNYTTVARDFFYYFQDGFSVRCVRYVESR